VQAQQKQKRQRQNRIIQVHGLGSGYGSKTVPVLRENDYELATGERSVFEQELGGREGDCQYGNVGHTHPKGGVDFEWQSVCQVCGDGGSLVCCPRCPVSVHLKCVGMKSPKEFVSCSQHHCTICHKSTSDAGGWMFRCSCCPSAYCDDHLPKEARILETCPRMEALGYHMKHGVYVHCSPMCENVAIQDFDWVPPETLARDPCPPPLDVWSFYGGEIDDCTDHAPEALLIQTTKRRRSSTTTTTTSNTKQEQSLSTSIQPENPKKKQKINHVTASVPQDEQKQPHKSTIDLAKPPSVVSLDEATI
jgi:hypothetical protein